MLTRRAALSTAGIAALIAQAPIGARAAPSETVRCYMASVFMPDFRSCQGLLFDLSEGPFLVDHVALFNGKFTSVKDGPTRFIDAPPKNVYRKAELYVPRSFLDEAHALHDTHERLCQSEERIWQGIRTAHGFPAP